MSRAGDPRMGWATVKWRRGTEPGRNCHSAHASAWTSTSDFGVAPACPPAASRSCTVQ